MADPSLFAPDPYTPIPYRTYAFDLPLAECAHVLSAAERFAPAGPAEYLIHVEFTPTGRRWSFVEQNIVGWINREGVAGPDSGLLTIPLFLLNTIINLFDGYASVGVRVDHDERRVVVGDADTEFSLSLPDQMKNPMVVDHDVDSCIVVLPTHISQLGLGLMTVPVALPDIAELESPLPFIRFAFDGDVLSARINWVNFGGPDLSVSVPAGGDHVGEFSAFAQALVRELCVTRTDTEDSVLIEFDHDLPNLMFIVTSEMSMRVELGLEHVFWYRGSLVSAFADDDLDVVADDRIGWDPTVRVVLDDAVVDATISLGLGGSASHVRLESLVVKDTPWTLEIAEEINAWNDKWGNVKLVRHDNDLYAVSDVPVEMIPTVPATARDLVRRTLEVREVIGVFI